MKRFEQKVWKEQHHIIDLINCTGRTFKHMLRALSFEFQLARSLSVLQNVELVLYFNLFSRDMIWLNPRPSECLLYWSFFCFLVGIFWRVLEWRHYTFTYKALTFVGTLIIVNSETENSWATHDIYFDLCLYKYMCVCSPNIF